MSILKNAILVSMLLIVSLPGFGGGPKNNWFGSSADVLAPFGIEPCASDATQCDVVGSSILIRTPAGIGANITTSQLIVDVPYTVWAAIFNNPFACDAFPGPCGLADLGSPAVNATVIWMAGNYSAADGTGYFQGFLGVGETDRDQPFSLPGDSDGLVNPNKAEVHFVVRRHPAPVDPAYNYDALNTFAGGCGDCVDEQFSVHKR